jgi:hypothetical protein
VHGNDEEDVASVVARQTLKTTLLEHVTNSDEIRDLRPELSD